jgi:hypothetical protein
VQSEIFRLGYRCAGDIYVWAAFWGKAVDVYRGCANQGTRSINSVFRMISRRRGSEAMQRARRGGTCTIESQGCLTEECGGAGVSCGVGGAICAEAVSVCVCVGYAGIPKLVNLKCAKAV